MESESSALINKSLNPKLEFPIKKSLWLTQEFCLYYVIILVAVYYTFSECIKISSTANPTFKNYSYLLSDGWLFNRKIDLSDHQFKSFREGIPSLTVLFTIFALVNCKFGNFGRLIGTLVFVLLMHGFKFIEPFLLVSINFIILKIMVISQWKSCNNLVVPFTWTFAILSLYLLGFKFFTWPWNGFLPHWTVIFKISILRMISFNLDYHKNKFVDGCESLFNDNNKNCKESGEEDCSELNLCYKCRVLKTSKNFNFISYFVYIFYPPLYLSGPIITFNDFSYQLTAKTIQTYSSVKMLWIYGLRLFGSLFTLEVILHLFYVCAIKSSAAWRNSTDQFTPLAFAAVAFFNLKIIWLKLLVIWRFSRFFSLLDGINPPENMIRCMCNNYSTLRFWRSWHRSFNLWILRYLYIPLGGRKTSNWNIFPIFAFVAIWHDINWQLLAWGFLIPVIILPEIFSNWTAKYFQLNKWKSYRIICAIAAAFNIFLMMLGNLIGFSVGIDGARLMLHQIIGKGGFFFVFSVFLSFFSGAQLMFEIREEEFRRTGKYSSM